MFENLKTLKLSGPLTHGVGAQYLQCPALCDGLEGGSRQHAVNAVAEEGGAALLLGCLLRQAGDVLVISIRHAGEPHAEAAQKQEAHVAEAFQTVANRGRVPGHISACYTGGVFPHQGTEIS